jgi:hypothetical protein
VDDNSRSFLSGGTLPLGGQLGDPAFVIVSVAGTPSGFTDGNKWTFPRGGSNRRDHQGSGL